ncbi:MAG TPA: helicase-related protein [Thermoplasmata archaeon]|nr:helicase-related protein [Thermoplasmata archaeon]
MPGVQHSRIRPNVLEDRLYQSNISRTAAEANTLTVLPTGLGKTAIALRVIADHLERFPTRSVLFLAPTRPLVTQHAESVRKTLFTPPILVLTGTVDPGGRARQYSAPQVVVATPQVIANDLERGNLTLDPFSLIVFDEAHRAVGDYPYARIGQANASTARARVLAMTASPGSRIERIREVWANLGIERFEYRTPNDPDVRPYVHDIGVQTVEVAVPPAVREIAVHIRETILRQVDWLKTERLLPETATGSRRDLLALGERLRREIDAAKHRGQSPPPAVWSAVTAQTTAMKALHALELIESQGADQLRSFLDEQEHPRSGRVAPAQRRFLSDPGIVRTQEILRDLKVDLPKVEVAVRLVRDELGQSPDARVILFTHYRDTAEAVARALREANDPAVRAERFVGQSVRGADVGLSQKEQVAILDKFRSGVVNCLVATSVAEEGLDIPSTDLVIFYEPVPDVIRTIQRRGRTGRARAGRAVVLVAEGTRDEGLARSAKARERRMHEMLETVEAEARSGTLAPPVPLSRQKLMTEFD